MLPLVHLPQPYTPGGQSWVSLVLCGLGAYGNSWHRADALYLLNT